MQPLGKVSVSYQQDNLNPQQHITVKVNQETSDYAQKVLSGDVMTDRHTCVNYTLSLSTAMVSFMSAMSISGVVGTMLAQPEASCDPNMDYGYHYDFVHENLSTGTKEFIVSVSLLALATLHAQHYYAKHKREHPEVDTAGLKLPKVLAYAASGAGSAIGFISGLAGNYFIKKYS